MKKILWLLIWCPLFILAQSEEDYSRLPDKTYLHLDRNLYSPGDTIWVKAYAFHRNNQKLSDNSYALHLQMLNQDGEEVSSYKILMVDGMGYGQIPVQDWMTPGLYQIIAHTSYMKNFGTQFFHRCNIEIRPPEGRLSIKTYFDQHHYNVGDTARVTFYAYDDYQVPIAKKRFRYDLQYKNKSLMKGGLRCYEDGRVSYSFPITTGSPVEAPVLHLSYYDNDNTAINYTQNVVVPMATNDLMVRFYPEGGDLVKGIDNKVAFEASDAQGQAVDIEGVLLEDGVEVFKVKTMKDGMGFFTWRPNGGEYRFKVIKPQVSNKVFDLPKAKPNAYSLSYVKRDAEKLYLLLSHNFEGDKTVNLWVSQYDQLIKVYTVTIAQRRLISLPLSDLPKGISTLTLVDAQNRPSAERLIYVPPQVPTIAISTDEKVYGLRKKVTVKMQLPDAVSQTHLSVAVVDSVLAYSPWLDRTSMKADALLKSELRGHVPDLDTYLEDNKLADIHRNLLLMTHGWRHYNWINNQQQLDTLSVYNFNRINGEVLKGRKPAKNAQMTALVLGASFAAAEFKTDEKGRFSITPRYETRHDQKILFQAKSDKDRRHVRIKLHNTDTLLFAKAVKRYQDDLKPTMQEMNRFVKLEEKEEENPFFSYESKLLQELVVYGERADEKDENTISEAVSAFAAGSMKGEELMGGHSFADFVEQVSFRAQYDQSTDRIIVKSRGGSIGFDDSDASSNDDEIGAEIYVNDISWGKDVSQLDFLNPEDIAQIVVLDPEGAFASYGSEGEYGVILVNTYDLTVEDKQELNRNMAVFGRFINSKEFYQPIYETKHQDSLVVVDNRITLDWEPFVETDDNGLATFDFYTDDISGTKQIVVQGIDEDGRLYYQTQEFEVRGVGEN